MTYTGVDINAYNFSRVTENDNQPTVTNAEGRTVLFKELVYLDGYFGEVQEVDGIANGATGKINIESDGKIKTEQVEATDTFTVGSTLWFVSGGAGAAGTLEDADPGSGTRYACGIITGEEGTGGAQTAVEFRPFVQRLDAADVSAAVAVNTAAIGTLASLTTTAKTDLVSAINEVDALVSTNITAIGTIASLTTTANTNCVGAINELDAEIGDLSTLTTTAKGTVVAAVNELDAENGDLSTLTTTATGTLVAAINEVDAHADTNISDIGTLQTEMLAEQAEPKTLVVKIIADASSGTAIAGLVENDEIVGVKVHCTAANANGTLILEDGNGNDISDAMICAVDTITVYGGSIDDSRSTLPAAGAQILSVGGTAADTRGIVVIEYIPA